MKRLWFAMVITSTLLYGVAFAADDLKKENAELRQRVDSLEQSLGEIKGKLAEQPKPAAEGEKPAVRSGVSIELYGYIKMDASYDTARTDEGNYARWVISHDTSKDDNQFNLTARQSRFGLNLFGPDVAGMKTSGRVEIDFYGAGGAENKNIPMMRHAYLKVEWPKIDLSILGGQTSDVISPLFPNTLNYVVGWWAGNPGYRRPQLRVTKGFDVGSDVRLLMEVAAARTIGHENSFDALVDTGEDAGFPSIQSRYSISLPILTSKKTTLGVSGHWGKEQYDLDSKDHSKRIDTWSANLDLTLPIVDWLSFQGEFWGGSDLDAYLAGIGQGIVITTADGASFINTGAKGTVVRARGIKALGGWGALGLGPFQQWRFNLGGGVDDPHNGDIPQTKMTQNLSLWGNVTYDINKAVQAGVEFSYWDTKYKGLADGIDFRAQTSLIYKF